MSKLLLAGVVLVGVGYLILRSRRNTGQFSKKPPSIESRSATRLVDNHRPFDHQGLERVIQTYKQDALHYQIFNWRNRKKIPLAAEETLFAKYPKILGEPVLKLPEDLILNPDVVSDWLKNHGKVVGEHEYVGRALADYLLAEADKKAEVIVQQFVEAATDK
jgi:hypothetical protein